MTKREMIEEFYPEEGIICADGFDNAIIGIDVVNCKAIYSISKMIEVLKEEGMEEIDGIEFLEYNVFGSYVGEMTAI